MIWVEFFGDEIDWICEVDVLIGEVIGDWEYVLIFLVIYFLIFEDIMDLVLLEIEVDMKS